MDKLAHALILLGTNQGDRFRNLQIAAELMNSQAGKLLSSSSIYETEAWGKTDQDDFLNKVVLLQTPLPAPQLLEALLAIEFQMGRERLEKWAPRTIDLDILFYNDEIVDLPGLTIPHPFLHERLFTLIPLAELVPEFIHPLIKVPVKLLIGSTIDRSAVKKVVLTDLNF